MYILNKEVKMESKLTVCFIYLVISVTNQVHPMPVFDLYVSEESTATIVCSFRAPKLQWYGPLSVDKYSEGANINPTLPPEIRGRLNITYTITGEFNLNITKVQQNDSGLYWCFGIVNNSTLKEYWLLKLKVMLKSVDISPSKQVTVQETTSVIFQCTARSVPVSLIAWYIGNTEIPTSDQPIPANDTVNSTLTYTGQRSDNTKSIHCNATSDDVSVVSEFTKLNITYPPSLQITPTYTTYKVIHGQNNTQLSCNVVDSNPNVTSYKWYKSGYDYSTSSILTFAKIDKSDSGVYSCSGYNGISPNGSANITVDVLYGPELTPISNQSRIEGSTLSAGCDVDSNPSVTNNSIIWTKQNNNSFTHTGQILSIINVNRLDKGTYICTAKIVMMPSEGGSVTATGTTTLSLDVKYSPALQIVPSFMLYKVIKGHTKRLTCDVSDSNPNVTSFNWYKTGSSISTSSVLTFDKVEKFHSGVYMCSGSNGISPDGSASVTVDVLYGPELTPISNQSRIEGSTLSVRCDVDSNPSITNNSIIWTKQNNNSFTHTGQILSIINVNRLDKGTYICTAKIVMMPSEGGSVTATGTTTLSLDVKYPPTLDREKNITAIENNRNVTFTCNVIDANPMSLSFSWYKVGMKDILSYSEFFVIEIINRTHAGTYICTVSNIAGNASTSFKLDVQYSPTITGISNNLNVSENGNYNLTCIVDSNPPSNIVWRYANGTTISAFKNNSNIVHMTNAKCDSTGDYICEANNSIGNITQDIVFVGVICKPRLNASSNFDNHILIGTGEGLDINLTVIAYPEPTFAWKFFNGTNVLPVANGFISDNKTAFPYVFISRMRKINMERDDFGNYSVTAQNIGGQHALAITYTVDAKRSPDHPDFRNLVCNISGGVFVEWKSAFHGGDKQKFHFLYKLVDSDNFETYNDIAEDPNGIQTSQLTGFATGLYIFKVMAVNTVGNSSSRTLNCSIEGVVSNESSLKTVGAIVGALSGLVVVGVIVVVIFIRKHSSRQDKEIELLDSTSKIKKESNEDELTENILYISADDVTNSVGDGIVYPEVNTLKKENCGNCNKSAAVYSVVDKSKFKNAKKKGNVKVADKQNKRAIGDTYENCENNRFHPSELESQRHAETSGSFLVATESKQKRNINGLAYADLVFKSNLGDKRFIIRGLENRTNYADVDFSKKAEPLPSSDSEEEKEATSTVENHNLEM